jgi:SRSO17 transposase
MTEEELEQWQEEFEAFHAREASLFERSESREQARKYLRGLLTEAQRKNSWQVAEALGGVYPRSHAAVTLSGTLGCRCGA